MMLKAYKPAFFVFAALMSAAAACFSQDTVIYQQGKSKNLNLNIGTGIGNMVNNLVNNTVVVVNNFIPKITQQAYEYQTTFETEVGPKLVTQLNGLAGNLDIDAISDLGATPDFNYSNSNSDNIFKYEKVKTYSKSYPLDANDKIKISNQYGRITVNTWDRNEVKVDVVIKVEAEDDGDLQKLLDGVQIKDGKSDNLVSFRTTIEPSGANSWKLFNWGLKKKHKVEINYTVNMPARTDLNVEDSYGGIVLPDLSGKVKISSSYGNVTAQNLTNSGCEIEGSYGNVKVGSFNGNRLDYSYGGVDMDECNNMKANLSYGSFKLGTLKGSLDLDLSYGGGFKIQDVSPSFKRLNVNSSYTGISLGIADNNSFNFDITTNYGGFNYNDAKVIVTSKTPPDNSKHIGSTRNYKGYFGKDSGSAQIVIHSTYGNVSFE
jgi:hypothetical protein